MPPGASQDAFARQRALMVQQQLVPRGIDDPAVLSAMGRVPREFFVPAPQRQLAYSAGPLPIGHGQTISQPYIVALMLSLLQLRPDHRVLEVGAGRGYQAAVLSQIAGEVHTLEIVAPLAQAARENLRELGYENATVHNVDGHRGLAERAPFHSIVAAAAPEAVPAALVDQLEVGGRLVIPVGSLWSVQQLQVLERRATGVHQRTVLSVRFVPMTGQP